MCSHDVFDRSITIKNLAFIHHLQANKKFNGMVVRKEHFSLDEGANNTSLERIKLLLNRYICQGTQY